MEEGLELMDRDSSPPYLQQRADDRSHHATQESVPDDVEFEAAIRLLPLCQEDSSKGLTMPSPSQGKGRKVVPSHEQGSRLPHGTYFRFRVGPNRE